MPPFANDLAVRALATPPEKSRKYSDSDRLYVEVYANGSKLWRLKFYKDGKERRLALGAFPEVGLMEARDRAKDARNLLAQGIDPVASGFVPQPTPSTFATVAHQYLDHLETKSAIGHSSKIRARMDKYVLPALGAREVSAITARNLIDLARAVEETGHLETAKRVIQLVGQVLRYAQSLGFEATDHSTALRGQLKKVRNKRMASPCADVTKLGRLLHTIANYRGNLFVASAIKLLPYLFCRPGELRGLRWKDIDFDESVVTIPARRGSTEGHYHIPLSRQSTRILRQLLPLRDSADQFVFLGEIGRDGQHRPISSMTINAAYKRLGIDTARDLTGDGWRDTAGVILHKHLKFDATGADYQSGGPSRRLMQAWADFLDSLDDDWSQWVNDGSGAQ